MRRCKGTGDDQRALAATTRAATSASRTIDAVERPTRLNEGMTESLVLQHEIMLRLSVAFERFTAIYLVHGRPRTVSTLHGADLAALGFNA